METNFKDYTIAHISANEVQHLTDLEHKLKENNKKDIVLIAYELQTPTVK